MTEPSLPEKSIFAQAVEIRSPAERAAFLDQACASRAEVEALLGALKMPGEFPGRVYHTLEEASKVCRAPIWRKCNN